jgi:hypothetical protein
MSIPLLARLSERLGFWFYLDRAGPGGLAGWIAPEAALESDWIEVQFSGRRVRAKLKPDALTFEGRKLYRFSVPLAFPERAFATFEAAGQHFARLVIARSNSAPLAFPTPPAPSFRAVASAPARGRALIVLAPIDWSFRRQRSQQLTEALSQHYDATFYLSPASLQLGGATIQLGERVSQPLLAAAPDCDLAARSLSEGEARACVDGMAALLGDASIDVLVQFPSWRPVAAHLARARLIYDCIDDHARLPHVTAPIEVEERALVQEAALCLATSETLRAHVSALGGVNVALVPNAALAPHPASWPHHRDAAIVYLGAVEDWFDFTLLRAAADAVPEAEVRVIGACGVVLPKLPRRIRFLGELEHADAMRALRHARVGIIPFRRDALTAAVNPVKAYEYLAAGLPVVMTPIGGAELAEAPGVSVAETPDAFPAAVSRAYAETRNQDRLAFVRWAEGETWQARAAQIVARLNA